MNKTLKITTTITIGYDDMPIELCENKNFTICLNNTFTTRFEIDMQELYKRTIIQANEIFDKYKNQILADSEMLKEYCFKKED